MTQKYLILIDDTSQSVLLEHIKNTLRNNDFELIYKEYNPKNYQKRKENGDLDFDKDAFEQEIKTLPYFNQLDSIVCDYNLIENVVNGFDIIKIIKGINQHYRKQVVLYSADIEAVIKNIINNSSNVRSDLKQLIKCNIDFIPKEGYDQKVIIHIKREPFNFEDELINWFYKRKEDEFNFLFPKYQGKKFEDIAIYLESETPESIEFKKDLLEQIIAYLSKINGLE